MTTSMNISAQGTLERLNTVGNVRQESAAASLGSTDFLRLMTAQLANQNPLEPQSNEQMLAQLAQFSDLENGSASRVALAEISSKLDALIVLQQRAADAAAAASPVTAASSVSASG